jgi:putative ABC transport system permease protein
VKTAAAASFLPVSGSGMTLYFNIQGRPPKSNDYAVANYRAVTTNYFSTLQIPLVQGRLLEPTDRENAPAVVVVNATMARTFFPNQSPLGQHIQIGGLPNAVNPWMEIVGVVGDVKQALASEATTEIYLPYRQADRIRPVLFLSLIVRTEGNPQALADSVRKTVHNIDPNQPVARVRTMEENVAESVAQPRFRTVLLAIFAGLALVLSALGIFSVMAYSVAQRAREIGVRVALGATRSRILQLILGYAMRLTVIGLVLGIAATFIFTRYVSSFLFHVPSHDPMTLVGIAVVVFLVSTLACYIPAHRATRVNPINALRQD